ncbi:S41 family peptidase [Acidaminobacter sp. JC074]|uniref:S41 family peptidase n=1 Tax=Acidaminobacter sp. JC074 TaxID=2530199 RepID=UPI001F0F82E6|nr:S41 family peptidase [Acidaminobacter sp. JC074]
MKKIFILLITLLLVSCSTSNIEIYSNEYNKMIQEATGLINEGNYFDATLILEEAIKESPKSSIAYNTLGFTYIELEKYSEAIDVLNMAVEINPDYSIAYSNLGNAHLGLFNDDKAKHAYNKAILSDKSNSYAYYGLALIYRDNNQYDLAIENYDLAIKYQRDIDYYISKLDCMITYGEYIDGLSFSEVAIKAFPNNYELHELKGMVLEQIDKEENVVAYYEKLAEDFPDEYNISLNLGVYYFKLGEYQKALDAFKSHDENFDNLVWKGYCYQYLEDYDQGKKVAKKVIDNYPEDFEGYNLMGNILASETDYMAASRYFQKALLKAEDDTPVVNLVASLKNAQRYKKAIDIGLKQVASYPESSDLLYEIMLSQFYRNDYKETIETAEKYFRLIEDYEAIYIIALCHYYNGEYDLALESLNDYLKIYPYDESSLSMKSSLESLTGSKLDTVKDYFDGNYLYSFNKEAFNSYRDPVTDKDIHELIRSVKSEDDPYTFVLTDIDYDYMMDASNNPLEVIHLKDNQIYMKFNRFDYNIDHHVIEAIDQVESPESKDLILDLRDNTGGSTESANNILNVLLPDLLISQMIYKDGYSYPYYSDKSMVSFNHIYVLVNEDTVSASELLALGLRTFLEDVTIIGQTTYGKGVGQDVFEDRINKRIYYIVSHYWNVREQNISEIGITPDIIIDGHELNDYLSEIN